MVVKSGNDNSLFFTTLKNYKMKQMENILTNSDIFCASLKKRTWQQGLPFGDSVKGEAVKDVAEVDHGKQFSQLGV